MHGIKKYRLNIFKDEYERKCLVQEKNLKNQNMFEIVCYVSLSHIDKVLFLRTTKIYFVWNHYITCLNSTYMYNDGQLIILYHSVHMGKKIDEMKSVSFNGKRLGLMWIYHSVVRCWVRIFWRILKFPFMEEQLRGRGSGNNTNVPRTYTFWCEFPTHIPCQRPSLVVYLGIFICNWSLYSICILQY